MQQDGRLDYGNGESALSFWQIDNIALNALVIAVLTTILSYQASSIIFDLLLGFKPRYQTAVANLQILLLVRRSSVLSVFKELFGRQHSDADCNCDASFEEPFPELAPEEHEPERPGRIKNSIALKLITLLLIAPIVNIASVILTLEHNKTLRFADTSFGAYALGVNEDYSYSKTEKLTETCEVNPILLSREEEALVKFITCTSSSGELQFQNQDIGMLTIRLSSNVSIQVQVLANGKRYIFGKQASLQTENDVYAIEHGLTKKTQELLFDFGFKILAEECGVPDISQAVDNTAGPARDMPEVHVLRSKFINCPRTPNYSIVTKVAEAMMPVMTLVNTDVLRVAEYSTVMNETRMTANPTFFDGKELQIVKRRRRNSSLAEIFIIVLALLTLRLLTIKFCNNDVELGLEVIMKKSLGLQCQKSLLRDSSTKVTYSHEDGRERVLKYRRSNKNKIGKDRFSFDIC